MESLKSLRLKKRAIHIFTKKKAVIHIYFDIKNGTVSGSGTELLSSHHRPMRLAGVR